MKKNQKIKKELEMWFLTEKLAKIERKTFYLQMKSLSNDFLRNNFLIFFPFDKFISYLTFRLVHICVFFSNKTNSKKNESNIFEKSRKK